jgi:NAD+ kinase
MQIPFRHVALIGKYQAVSSGATGASSRQALERIAHFLMDQGCEVVVESDTASQYGA